MYTPKNRLSNEARAITPVRVRNVASFTKGVYKPAKQAVRVRREMFVRAFTQSVSLFSIMFCLFSSNVRRCAFMSPPIIAAKVSAAIILITMA